MIRLLLRLFKITDFEICKSCETLKAQLAFERDEKRELRETLLNILNPKMTESAPVEISPISRQAMTFSRKRAILEERDREEARLRGASIHIGKPDYPKEVNKKVEEVESNKIVQQTKSVQELEQELGIVEDNIG